MTSTPRTHPSRSHTSPLGANPPGRLVRLWKAGGGPPEPENHGGAQDDEQHNGHHFHHGEPVFNRAEILDGARVEIQQHHREAQTTTSTGAFRGTRSPCRRLAATASAPTAITWPSNMRSARKAGPGVEIDLRISAEDPALGWTTAISERLKTMATAANAAIT